MMLRIIGVALLSTPILTLIILQRAGINIIAELDSYLHEKSQSTKFTRLILKAFTSKSAKEKQLEWVQKFDTQWKELYKTEQREIYLLDEKDMLEKGAWAGTLTPDEQEKLNQVEKELRKSRLDMWQNGERLAELFHDGMAYDGRGVWAGEYCELGLDTEQIWEDEKLSCEVRLGCCSRGCGCCDKPRETRKGQPGTLDMGEKWHCTIECGCCIRWRGFRLPEELEDAVKV